MSWLLTTLLGFFAGFYLVLIQCIVEGNIMRARVGDSTLRARTAQAVCLLVGLIWALGAIWVFSWMQS